MASGTWAAERWHCPRLALTAITAENPRDVQDRCGLFCEITSAPQDRCGLGCGRHAGHPGSVWPFVPKAPQMTGIGAAFLPPPRLTSRIGVAFCSQRSPDNRDRGCLFVRPRVGQPGSGSPVGRNTLGTARIGVAGTPSCLRTVRIASAGCASPVLDSPDRCRLGFRTVPARAERFQWPVRRWVEEK